MDAEASGGYRTRSFGMFASLPPLSLCPRRPFPFSHRRGHSSYLSILPFESITSSFYFALEALFLI
jgi:hypothetical protein